MNENYQTFLNGLGAQFSGDQLISFGHDAAEDLEASLSQTIITAYDEIGLIRVTGKDAKTYLQNQLSNDVFEVTSELSQLNSHSSPKGRLYTIFRLYLKDNEYYMAMPKTLIQTFKQRISKYILMSDVQLSDLVDSHTLLGFSGTSAASTLQKHFTNIPNEIDAVITEQDLTIIKVPGNLPRFEIIGEHSQIIEFWKKVTTQSTPISPNIWALQNIRAGIPMIYPETEESFIAQMVNLDQVNGLSFKKGCFPGQEVIARTQYRGAIKRRMFYLHISGQSIPQPGDNIANKENPTKSLGEIVDARATSKNSSEALAVMQLAHIDDQSLTLANDTKAVIKIGKLPYQE